MVVVPLVPVASVAVTVTSPGLIELAVKTPDEESMLPKSESFIDQVTGVTAPLAEKVVVSPLLTVEFEGVTITDAEELVSVV